MNKQQFYSTLNLYLNKKCDCKNDLIHFCNITQYDLYKNVTNYYYINDLNMEIKKIIFDKDSDQDFLAKDNCKLNHKSLNIFTLILLSMISNNSFKKDYKGKIIKYFKSN